MDLHIENAYPEDRKSIVDLLHQRNLLTDDLPTDLSHFVVFKENDVVIGVAGLEQFGQIGLLRSVAVDPSLQGKQLGARLTEHVLNNAQSVGIREVYSITATAKPYFERHGFEAVDRKEVPLAIQATQQFSSLCPSSAMVMKRRLI